jgi:hypothetical protein
VQLASGTLSVAGLTRLERLELEEFLKIETGPSFRPGSFQFILDEKPPSTIGQFDLWTFVTSEASYTIPFLCAWLAAKKLRFKATVERRDKHVVTRRTIEVDLSPDRDADDRVAETVKSITDLINDST